RRRGGPAGGAHPPPRRRHRALARSREAERLGAPGPRGRAAVIGYDPPRRATLTAVLVLVAATAAADSTKPSDVVDRQLAAYNAKDIEAYLACFAPDAEILEFPAKSLAKGTAALRERYTKRFADAILHATIADRMVGEGKVVDHEKIRITWPEGPGTWEATAIYEIDGALIKRVTFVFGAKTVDAKK